MPPKKKGGKKTDDSWENELGETIEPTTQDANGEDAVKDADEKGATGGGGLLAALRKNRGKKAKKGGNANDFVDGEDADGASEEEKDGNFALDFNYKAPQEATFDDDEDVFNQYAKGKKGGRIAPGKQAAKEDEDEDGDGEEGGKMKTKKEKEKEKKEREKQRKKEQVYASSVLIETFPYLHYTKGREEEDHCASSGAESRSCKARSRGEEGRADHGSGGCTWKEEESQCCPRGHSKAARG